MLQLLFQYCVHRATTLLEFDIYVYWQKGVFIVGKRVTFVKENSGKMFVSGFKAPKLC